MPEIIWRYLNKDVALRRNFYYLMKKTILIATLLLSAIISFSQQVRKVKFGVHAGINVANITVKTQGITYTPSSLIGLNAGLSAELPVSKSIAIQPELDFSQLGAKTKVPYNVLGPIFSGSTDNSDYTVKSTLNYLVLPVLVKFKVPRTGLGIYIGPQYGLLISESDNYKNNTQSISVNGKKDYNSSDFSGIFGAEYFFPVGVGIAARYQLGFANIQKDAGNVTVKNHAFSFTVGYRF